MTKLKEVYRCAVCGNIVEVMHEAGGTLSCCGQPMELLTENTVDAATEKHVPVVEPIEGGYRVKEWIELVECDKVQRKHLKPGEKPEAVFYTDCKNVYAREYCNLHGHWRSK